MVASPFRIIFFIVFFFIFFQNIAIADQIVILILSPNDAYLDETKTFTIEFMSTQNLSNVVMHFYIDAEKKGAKKLIYVEKNKKYLFTFDCYFDKNSYLGEHYIELKTDFVTENQINNSENYYDLVYVYDNKKLSSCFFVYIFILFLFVMGAIFWKKEWKKYSVIDFSDINRKFLFSFIITSLPISISIFILYLSEKPELKVGILFILGSFIISFIFALYSFIIAEKKSSVKADNSILCSICFIILGLIEMVTLILIY